MLYNIFLPYANNSHIANLFTYISFRSGVAILLSMVICFIIAPRLINYLKNIQKNGQPIRQDGPETHLAKAGTPTMGGIMILASTIISSLLLADLSNIYIWVCILVFISFGILGFIDDYKKVSQNNYKGISAKAKFSIQLIVSFIAFLAIQYASNHEYKSLLSLPFLKNIFLDLGYFYIPFAMVVIIGSSNAVNLTDGLDGLAVGTIIISVASFSFISYLVGNSIYAEYLQVVYIPKAGELTILCCSIIGSSLGFLWYNAKPAEIFMGDTGSLSLGGVLGTISVITKHEIVLAIIGGVFVLETLSVIMQVSYFKATKGKRIFLMAPLHHHFEKKGWPETKVVIRFWILAIIFALIGLSSLKLR